MPRENKNLVIGPDAQKLGLSREYLEVSAMAMAKDGRPQVQGDAGTLGLSLGQIRGAVGDFVNSAIDQFFIRPGPKQVAVVTRRKILGGEIGKSEWYVKQGLAKIFDEDIDSGRALTMGRLGLRNPIVERAVAMVDVVSRDDSEEITTAKLRPTIQEIGSLQVAASITSKVKNPVRVVRDMGGIEGARARLEGPVFERAVSGVFENSRFLESCNLIIKQSKAQDVSPAPYLEALVKSAVLGYLGSLAPHETGLEILPGMTAVDPTWTNQAEIDKLTEAKLRAQAVREEGAAKAEVAGETTRQLVENVGPLVGAILASIPRGGSARRAGRRQSR